MCQFHTDSYILYPSFLDQFESMWPKKAELKADFCWYAPMLSQMIKKPFSIVHADCESHAGMILSQPTQLQLCCAVQLCQGKGICGGDLLFSFVNELFCTLTFDNSSDRISNLIKYHDT